MNLSDFDYHLPPDRIGQKAIEPRDSCKLMVVNRSDQTISHHIFKDLEQILDSNTVLVLNDTKVFPARLFGHKSTGGKVEILLLKQLSSNSFSCLSRGNLKNMQEVIFETDLTAVFLKMVDSENQITFNNSGPDLLTKLDELGKTPLPPYIHPQESEEKLREQYQTIYAEKKGSAAAPTAGLHFTGPLLSKLTNKGVQIEKITLHVGLGTFKPVTSDQISTKKLHTESFEITKDTADRLNQTKKAGKKIIAVGTTTCRVLESQTNMKGELVSGEGETDIFIQPGYNFKLLDGLITNFHFPETSLLMLVSALVSKPNTQNEFFSLKESLIGRAYQEAIDSGYKFFSFGDAMIIL